MYLLFGAGFAGFVVFEAFRIYRKTSAGEHPFKSKNGVMRWHMGVSLVLAGVSGFGAVYWANNSISQAFYFGLTLPATLSTLLAGTSKDPSSAASHSTRTDGARVDDLHVGAYQPVSSLRVFLRSYLPI